MKNVGTTSRAGSHKSELAKISELRIQKMGYHYIFFVINLILMKLDEVEVPMGSATSPNSIKIGWKKRVLLLAHLMDVSSVKVPLRSC